MEKSIQQLVELGGRTAQDFGVGRVLGQMLALLYFSETEKSLDEMEESLGLSKAAVSIAARDLEKLGLLQRVWRPNDRKSYYRTVENLGLALRHGVLRQIESSMMDIENVLGKLQKDLNASEPTPDPEHEFLVKRLRRAEELQARSKRMLNSPLIKLLVR